MEITSLRGLAGCGGKSNPINLYMVSLLRAMDWVLFGDRLTARNLTKSHSKSSKNVSAGAGLLFSPLWRAEIYKSMEITFPAGIGRVRGRIKSEESFLI